jgi:hypothetical protein
MVCVFFFLSSLFPPTEQRLAYKRNAKERDIKERKRDKKMR